MDHIIALKGRQGSGKTETIDILAHVIFAQNHQFQLQNETAIGSKDFRAVYKFENVMIGVTSVGDTYDLVKENLQKLVSAGCTICICACHTRDNGEYPHGTNTAISEFDPPFQIQFIPKTLQEREEQYLATNQSDAMILYRSLNTVI
ncbi:MAG TPA: hypothetical protein VG537_00110 [Candidatus Kapabacteria bacterium]|jgi:hypothetical protein|nr:hypothetical protein [Candidatus Kapabacteria bacterium]